MQDNKLKSLMTKFESGRRLSTQKLPNADHFSNLISDKLGKYYVIYDILFRCDEALWGKIESSPTKEYKQHVKNTLDSFEHSVKSELERRRLTYKSTQDNEYDTIDEISQF